MGECSRDVKMFQWANVAERRRLWDVGGNTLFRTVSSIEGEQAWLAEPRFRSTEGNDLLTM